MLPLADTIRSYSFPLVNWLLIGANILVFLFQVSLGEQARELVETFGLVPVRFLADPESGEIVTLFTSMFLHAGWLHLFSNILALYIFGDNVEDRMGPSRYIFFYLLCGVAAALAHLFFNPSSELPTIGASGAISGVLGAYFVLFPHACVTTLILFFFIPFFVQIPALLYLGFWFFSQLLAGTFAVVSGAQAYGGVAWWAHAGGFIAGMILIWFFVRPPTRHPYTDEYWPW